MIQMTMIITTVTLKTFLRVIKLNIIMKSTKTTNSKLLGKRNDSITNSKAKVVKPNEAVKSKPLTKPITTNPKKPPPHDQKSALNHNPSKTVKRKITPVRRASAHTDNELNGFTDVNKIIEEGKVREEGLKKRLELLREYAKLAVVRKQSEGNNAEENKDLINKLDEYNNEIHNFKNTIENVAHITKETHSEIRKTKDLIANIDTSQSRFGGSFQSKFVEDEDADLFRNIPEKVEVEQQSRAVEGNEEDIVSMFLLLKDMLLLMATLWKTRIMEKTLKTHYQK